MVPSASISYTKYNNYGTQKRTLTLKLILNGNESLLGLCLHSGQCQGYFWQDVSCHQVVCKRYQKSFYMGISNSNKPESNFNNMTSNQQYPIHIYMYMYVAPNFRDIIFSGILWLTLCSQKSFHYNFYGCGIFNVYCQQQFIPKINHFAIWSTWWKFAPQKFGVIRY